MPEGDVVFRTGKDIREALAGTVLTRGQFRHPELATVDLAGRTVLDVRTVGKHLFTRFSGAISLHSHLRMDGSWEVYPVGARWRHPAHQVRVILGSHDTQVIGVRVHELKLLRTDREQEMVAHLGPDLLDPQWTDEHAERAAQALASHPDRELGLALTDQRTMAGVGNLYKVEICFVLGVSPWTPASKVDSHKVVDLARKLLLANRDRFEQSTTGELTHGRRHWVYDRSRHGCFRCGGQVRVADQGRHQQRRPTWFCPRCQTGPQPTD